MASESGAAPRPELRLEDRSVDLSVDLLVVGGGVLGLWIARRARAAGLTVALVERRRFGAGASGGPLGALMPHQPEGWTEIKAFQLAALAEAPALLAALEAETGRATGYGRIGRLRAVAVSRAGAEAERAAAAAATTWAALDPAFLCRAVSAEAAAAAYPGWTEDPATAREAFVEDRLSARLSPTGVVAALAAALRADPGATVLEGAALEAWDGAARLSTGATVAAGAVALSAGWETFALAARLGAWPHEAPLGDGVKGQAAVFDPAAAGRAVPRGAPMLYRRGVYVVPHADGRVAVGSTSRAEWSGAPDAVDPGDRAFLAEAAALCPMLAGLRPVAEWAGVRPRTATRDPIVGRLPCVEPSPGGAAPLWIATGGYKITFAIAHRLAAALVDRIVGAAAPTPMPEGFAAAAHLARAGRA